MALNSGTATIVKDKAEALFAKGRYAEALATYEKIKAQGEKDPRIYLRMGDIARKINDGDTAVRHYKDAIRSFTRLGFLIKAIAVCKVVISIDPEHNEVQAFLAELYARQGGGGAAPRPAEETTGPRETDIQKKAPPLEAKEAPVRPKKAVPKTPLFNDLREDEFLEAIEKVRSVAFMDGDFVFHKGDSGDSIYFVAEGGVCVRGVGKDGSPFCLATLKEGDVFGEFGFFSDAKRTMDVVSDGESTLLELTKQDLNDIIARHPRVKDVLKEFYKERVADRIMAISDVFRPLSAPDRKEVLKRASIERYPRGYILMKEGEKGDTMYLIKHGRVLVWLTGMEGGPLMVTELSEGDFFGEVALATAKPRVANVTALTEVELVVFSRPMIKDILVKYPEVKERLSRIIKERVLDVVKAREAGPPGKGQDAGLT